METWTKTCVTLFNFEPQPLVITTALRSFEESMCRFRLSSWGELRVPEGITIQHMAGIGWPFLATANLSSNDQQYPRLKQIKDRCEE